VECLKHFCTVFWSHLKCVVSEGLSTQPSRDLEVSLFKFHAQKDKENMENKTHSFTHAKGLNIDPFKFSAPPLKL
jgi:hypothetical protein